MDLVIILEIKCIQNGLITFILTDTQPHFNKLLLLVLKIIFILPETTISWTISLGFAIMSVLLPCKPPFLGSYLLCRMEPSAWKWFGASFLALAEFVMNMQISVSGSCYALFFHISGIAIFWGRCQEFMKSRKSNLDFLVKGYRQLQILEKIHNSSYRGRILPVMLFGVVLVEILCGFAVFVLFHRASLFQTTIFLVLYLDVFLVSMVILTCAAYIHVKTKGWINVAKFRIGENGNFYAYLRRVNKSFRPLRLEFGNNYVGRLTSLVIQGFCVRRTVSLLLLVGV